MLDTKNLKEELFLLAHWFTLTWTHVSGSGMNEAGHEGTGASSWPLEIGEEEGEYRRCQGKIKP